MKMKLRDPLTLAPHVIFANPRFRAKSAKKFFLSFGSNLTHEFTKEHLSIE